MRPHDATMMIDTWKVIQKFITLSYYKTILQTAIS